MARSEESVDASHRRRRATLPCAKSGIAPKGLPQGNHGGSI
jgi:hypothetical protein